MGNVWGRQGEGKEGGGEEDTRVTGMCREGEGGGAPVSQEEEEAGWTPTLLNTQQYKNTATLHDEKATKCMYT